MWGGESDWCISGTKILGFYLNYVQCEGGREELGIESCVHMACGNGHIDRFRKESVPHLFTKYAAQPPPPVCSLSRRSPDQQGWGLPTPQPHAAGSPQIKHGILQSSSSHPQNYNIPCTPLKRSCMSNHLNECYIIYKFCCY